MQPKAQIDLLEMGIPREDVLNAEVLHDHHAGEIDEGDVRLVVVLLPHLPGPAELVRGNADQLVGSRVNIGQNGVNKALGFIRVPSLPSL
jgi:hypothetical protein